MQVEFHYIFKLFKKKVYPLLSEKNNLIDKHQANEYIEDWSSNFFWINLSFFFFFLSLDPLECDLSGGMCFFLKL